MPWDSSEEQMGGPREMRIHVQRVIAIPAPHNMPPPPETMGPFAPPPPPPQGHDQNEVSNYIISWCNRFFAMITYSVLIMWLNKKKVYSLNTFIA